MKGVLTPTWSAKNQKIQFVLVEFPLPSHDWLQSKSDEILASLYDFHSLTKLLHKYTKLDPPYLNICLLESGKVSIDTLYSMNQTYKKIRMNKKKESQRDKSGG